MKNNSNYREVSHEYAIGSQPSGDKFEAMFALPGDMEWRICRDWSGNNLGFDSPELAEQMAGRRLIAELNRRLTIEGK